MALVDMSETYPMTNVGEHIDGTDVYQSNRNLLDNPWFTNPVNQRGQTTYSGGGTWIKTIDRWYLVNGSGANSLTVQSGYLSVKSDANGFAQPIETEMAAALNGKTLTCSVLFNNGTIENATGVYDSAASKNIGNGFYFGLIGGKQILVSYLTGNGVTQDIKAMKVELGSVSTLANDAPPKQSQEENDCKWYFERIKAIGGNYAPMGFGYATSATEATIFVPMHAKRGSGYTVSTSGSFRLVNGQTTYSVSAISKYSSVSNNWLVLTVTSSGLTAGQPLEFGARGDSTAYIDVNNDL